MYGHNSVCLSHTHRTASHRGSAAVTCIHLVHFQIRVLAATQQCHPRLNQEGGKIHLFKQMFFLFFVAPQCWEILLSCNINFQRSGRNKHSLHTLKTWLLPLSLYHLARNRRPPRDTALHLCTCRALCLAGLSALPAERLPLGGHSPTGKSVSSLL